MNTKGIVLAGGAGTRLYPLTKTVCKQLLPVYDKPMVYYPISTLMLAGIREILIISTPKDIHFFEDMFEDGSQLGMKFEYKVQEKPQGIAQSFIIGDEFIGKDRVCLILGDNIFYGEHAFLKKAIQNKDGADIFAYHVKHPERYGVVEFDEKGAVLSLEEKPKVPKSTFAVTGLYVYDSEVVSITKLLKPSARGELEITDLNIAYLKEKKLRVHKLNRGMAWLDTGTHRSLQDACNFIETLEVRQGLKIGCIEETAYHMGFIGLSQLEKIIKDLGPSEYRDYLQAILNWE